MCVEGRETGRKTTVQNLAIPDAGSGGWGGGRGKGEGACVLDVFVFRILPVHYSTTHYLNRLYIMISIIF